MKCKYCGQEFEQNKRGRKREYCNKKECLKKAKNEANKKWYSKKLKSLNGTNLKIIEQSKVIYSSTEKQETKLKMANIGDIVEIAREFGTVRYKLIELLRTENEIVNKFNKQDQTFLHKLEFLEELTDDEAKEMIIEEKKSRELRRNSKNRKYLIEAMLNSILMKNPNAFISRASKYEGDICKIIETLKKDDDMYVKNKEEKLGIEDAKKESVMKA